MAAMDRVASTRTYVVIAHRLSTVANADAIAVLHEGVVAELGTHAELLARPDGLYASLWAKHAQEKEAELQAPEASSAATAPSS